MQFLPLGLLLAVVFGRAGVDGCSSLGLCYQTWGDNISVLSDFISLSADNNTDNSGPLGAGGAQARTLAGLAQYRGTSLI